MSSLRALTISTLLACLILAGCGYSLQARSDLPFEEVAIGRIGNKTAEPKIQDIMARAMAEVLMEYGFAIGTDAPYRIEGEITRFDLRVLSERGLTATEYQVLIQGSFRLVDTRSGSFTPLTKTESLFVTSFSSGGRIESVLALKELATQTALRNLSIELVRELLSRREAVR